jgi:hypothetical protein
LFTSLFDAPRLTALFFAVLALGLHSEPRCRAPGATTEGIG